MDIYNFGYLYCHYIDSSPLDSLVLINGQNIDRYFSNLFYLKLISIHLQAF